MSKWWVNPSEKQTYLERAWQMFFVNTTFAFGIFVWLMIIAGMAWGSSVEIPYHLDSNKYTSCVELANGTGVRCWLPRTWYYVIFYGLVTVLVGMIVYYRNDFKTTHRIKRIREIGTIEDYLRDGLPGLQIDRILKFDEYWRQLKSADRQSGLAHHNLNSELFVCRTNDYNCEIEFSDEYLDNLPHSFDFEALLHRSGIVEAARALPNCRRLRVGGDGLSELHYLRPITN